MSAPAAPAPVPSSWELRRRPVAMSPERLAALSESAQDRTEVLLLTATPREELGAVGDWQRLKDLAFAGQVREIAAAWNRAPEKVREFAADEVALAVGASPTTGGRLVTTALALADLPGLLEAVETGELTERHCLAVLRELDQVPLTLEQRQAVVLVLVGRYAGQTPGELVKDLRRLVLQVDAAAARARRDTATRDRGVSVYGRPDAQAALHAHGPAERLAAVRARLQAELEAEQRHPDDVRTRAQREFDLLVDLLTRGTVDDQPLPDYAVQVVVPFSTATGGDLELADLPGLGPLLPGTARELLGHAATVTQVAVDEHGVVIAVGADLPTPRPEHLETHAWTPDDDERPACDVVADALRAMAEPPATRDLSTKAYRIPTRTAKLVKARDRTCVFPGCHRRVTDVDHRLPWPLGPTSPENLQCLCRHHHRAKQAAFTVTLRPDGTTVWTTRGGWQFTRPPSTY